MSAKAEEAAPEGGKAPAKSKKMLIIILGAVLVLALAGGGAFIYISKKHAAEAAEAEAAGEGGEAAAHKPAAEKPPAKVAANIPKTPPVYLPMDNMVVNLADPGGERVAQIGITLEVVDAKAVDTVKAYLPSIRSQVLMLISARTAEEILTQAGKEKLAEDILKAASIPFGGGGGEEEEQGAKSKKKRKVEVEYPVIGVLFSSFIVQ